LTLLYIQWRRIYRHTLIRHLHTSSLSHQTSTYIQPIADRVAQHLEIISNNFRFGTRRTRILMGLIMYDLVLRVNPMGRMMVR